MPGAVDGVTERVQTSGGVVLGFIAVDEHHPAGPDRRAENAFLDDPISDGPRGAITGTADHLAIGRQTERLGGLFRQRPGNFLALDNRRQQVRIESEFG